MSAAALRAATPHRMSSSKRIIGRWRITAMDNWDQGSRRPGRARLHQVRRAVLGELGFIAVSGELDCRDADRDSRPGVEFSWQGSDEGDDVSGRGWATLNPDDTLDDHIYFHLCDESAFRPRGSAESSGEHGPPGAAHGPAALTARRPVAFGFWRGRLALRRGPRIRTLRNRACTLTSWYLRNYRGS